MQFFDGGVSRFFFDVGDKPESFALIVPFLVADNVNLLNRSIRREKLKRENNHVE